MRCARCNRPLLNPAVTAGRFGWGRVCAKKAGLLVPRPRPRLTAAERARLRQRCDLTRDWVDAMEKEKMLAVTLPWPAKDLSPNARVHWGQKAKAAKLARQTAFALAREAGLIPRLIRNSSKVEVSLGFVPPSRRRYDLDNCLAAMKSSLDGIADALQVDDSRFVLRLELAKDTVGGFVVVEVRYE